MNRIITFEYEEDGEIRKQLMYNKTFFVYEGISSYFINYNNISLPIEEQWHIAKVSYDDKIRIFEWEGIIDEFIYYDITNVIFKLFYNMFKDEFEYG